MYVLQYVVLTDTILNSHNAGRVQRRLRVSVYYSLIITPLIQITRWVGALHGLVLRDIVGQCALRVRVFL